MFSWFSNQKITPSQNNGQPDAAGWAPEGAAVTGGGLQRVRKMDARASQGVAPFLFYRASQNGRPIGASSPRCASIVRKKRNPPSDPQASPPTSARVASHWSRSVAPGRRGACVGRSSSPCSFFSLSHTKT